MSKVHTNLLKNTKFEIAWTIIKYCQVNDIVFVYMDIFIIHLKYNLIYIFSVYGTVMLSNKFEIFWILKLIFLMLKLK